MLYSIYHVLMEGGGGGGSGGISKEEDQAIAKFRTCPKYGVSLRNISNNFIHHGPHVQVQMNFIKFINYVQLRHNSYSMASEYHNFAVLQKTLSCDWWHVMK